MIGRHGLHIRPSRLKDNLLEFGFPCDQKTVDRLFSENNGFAEPFFRLLGAKDVHSFDNSGYEGATHLHDMNQEIPVCFKEQYSVVLDGGSLEHIFNFPVAIRNCMEMVRVGGHYLGITPTNNLMGDGFYQFSPELYFSVFSEANGFDLVSMVIYEDSPRARWYSVRSPRSVNARVTLTNRVPTELLVMAKKVASAPVFEPFPQQSDYVPKWSEAYTGVDKHFDVRKQSKLFSLATSLIPEYIKWWAERMRGYHSGFDPRFFQPIDRTGPNKNAKRKLSGRTASEGALAATQEPERGKPQGAEGRGGRTEGREQAPRE
jgi:hypothetical protein